MADCRLKLNELMNSLSSKEKTLAQYIINYPSKVINMSINKLALECNVSVSTIIRLCKTAGYEGYKSLCRELSVDIVQSQANQKSDYADIQPGAELALILETVCQNDIRAIENTLAVLRKEELSHAVDVILAANRVDFYGIAASGLVAIDACNKFVRIKKISMSSSDAHQQILNASSLTPDDVAVLISYSGSTKDILETADVVKKTGATLISLTKFSKNLLTKKADIRLYSSSSETLVRSGPMGSRIGQLTVIDILYTAVASRQYDEVKQNLDLTSQLASQKHI